MTKKKQTSASSAMTNFQNTSDVSYSGAAELWAIEGALKKYNVDLVNKLSYYFHDCLRVLEFGAGIGTLAELWAKKTGVTPQCLEIDPDLRRIIQKRGLICFDKLKNVDGVFDGIYTSNVLEHIEHDGIVLGHLYEKLKDNGVIVVYVPAFMCLYSNMDLAVGHYRRYSAEELCLKLKIAGFQVVLQRYSDSIGFIVWWYLKIRGSQGGSELSNHHALSLYDKFIYPVSAFLDACGMKFLLGKNLMVVAKKIPR
jgi:SAM-dependent methyltransferase